MKDRSESKTNKVARLKCQVTQWTDELFSLREVLNLETSKLSRIRSSILEEEWQDEIMEKSSGEMMWWVWWICSCMRQEHMTWCKYNKRSVNYVSVFLYLYSAYAARTVVILKMEYIYIYIYLTTFLFLILKMLHAGNGTYVNYIFLKLITCFLCDYTCMGFLVRILRLRFSAGKSIAMESHAIRFRFWMIPRYHEYIQKWGEYILRMMKISTYKIKLKLSWA